MVAPPARLPPGDLTASLGPEELDKLKATVMFTEDDERALGSRPYVREDDW